MSFFARFKSAPHPPPSGEVSVAARAAQAAAAASNRDSRVENAKKPILLRAHSSCVTDLASDSKHKRIWTVSKDGSIAVWEKPDKIKAERSAVPQATIETKLGEVLCVFYNPQTKQFWTSHKASNVIVLWSSSGSKALEIKLELSHPVNCFCKVGHDEVWAGSFDSIIMFNNDGDRLHSTSTGAGRMIFIRQGTVPYVWSGGGVSTSDLLASSSIFKWSVTHPPSARQPFKLDNGGNAPHKQRLTCMCETKEHIWTGCRGKVVCVWSKKLAEGVTSAGSQKILVVHRMQDIPSTPLDIIFAGSHVWMCAEDGCQVVFISWRGDQSNLLTQPFSNVFHVAHEQRVPRLLHIPEMDQLWCARDDGSVSILEVPNGSFQSQNIVHTFKNAAGDRYVGEIKEGNMVDRMEMTIADDDSERMNFIKEGHGELHYANQDLYVGQFRSDMRHGHGVLRKSNGRRFFGHWRNDCRDGPGIDVLPDGTCFEGNFSKDVRKGPGTLRLPTGAKIEGIWNGDDIVSAKYTDSHNLDANDRHRMLLLQCDVQSKLEKLANEELEEHTDPLWETFIYVKPREELSTDLKALAMLLRQGQDHVRSYLQRKLKDRSHPIGRLIQEFIDFFLAAYHGQEVLKSKTTARYFLHHASHDVHSFSSELCKLQLLPLYQQAVIAVFGEGQQDEHNGSHVCHSCLHIVLFDKIYPTIIKLYRIVFKEKDVQYSTKLRALSDAQVSDFGAKVAVERVSSQESKAAVEAVREPSVSYSSYRFTLDPSDGAESDRLGLGEFLKEAEERGVDAIAKEEGAMGYEECADTKEMTTEEYFDQYRRPYSQAISEMKKLSESSPDERCRDAIKKSRIILDITGAIVSYWKHGGINMEKLGADDLMPAFMYSLVKANVPNLYSELQFLNEFVVERNYSSDQFNHYLMTRKRMSDLEAALHFIDSIDMNVRDEKNALVPVTTMVDRVLNLLQVGVAEYLERKVVPHTLWISELFLRIGNRGPKFSGQDLPLRQGHDRSLCSNAHSCLKFAVPLFNSVGIDLKEEVTSGTLSPTHSPQLGLDNSYPDYVLSFRLVFPLHVYSKIAEDVASFSLDDTARF